jgi:hypothetical protein
MSGEVEPSLRIKGYTASKVPDPVGVLILTGAELWFRGLATSAPLKPIGS